MKRSRRPVLKLPDELSRLTLGYRYKLVWQSYLADVYRFTNPLGINNLYLKRHRCRANNNSIRERDIINWLQGKIPVPEVIGFAKDRWFYYLLLTELQGIPAHQLIRKIPAEQMIRLMTAAIKRFHTVPIKDCPFDETLGTKLRKIRFCIDQGYLRKDIYHKNSTRMAEEDFAYLLENKPDREDLVFSHGDFCLPNILLSGEEVTGFVDLGEAGVCDRYMDISTLAITMCYNYKRFDRFFYYCRLIFEEYGIEHPDWNKLQFYQLINEML